MAPVEKTALSNVALDIVRDTTPKDLAEPSAKAGHPVKHGDIVPFAKRDCKDCIGTGEWHRARTERDARGKLIPLRGEATDFVAMLCGCAYKRFMRFHKNNRNMIYDEKGNPYWIEGTDGDKNSFAAKEEAAAKAAVPESS